MKNFIFLLFCLYINISFSQNAISDSLRHEVNIIAAYLDTRSVVVRWVPATPSVWSLSRFYGYRLERCEVDTLSGIQSPWIILGDSVRKPISLEQWREMVSRNPDDLYLQAAGQAHHGERQETGETLADLLKKSDEFKNYYAAAMLSSEFSSIAAEASALRFEDRDISPGKLYIYRIRSLCPESKLLIAEGITSVSTTYFEAFPKIIIDQVYEGENVVEMSWDKRTYNQFYSAYNIYRSTDKGNTWKKLNQIPFAYTGIKNENLLFYRDSLDENYIKMQYQLEGITPYTVTGPRSETLEAMGRDRTPPTAPFNIETQYLGQRRMKITWQVDPNDQDVGGFRISKSNEANEGFLELTDTALPADTRMYIDTNCNELINNYYYVGVFDQEGNANVGFPKYGTIIDSVPPSPPLGLTGSVDTNGVVTLNWPLGPEPDLKGYFVHSSNRLDQTFINRTSHPVQDTIWRDTIPLNVLTEKIYYKIVAIDMRSNYSGYSNLLTLSKPDKVAPTAPVFIEARNDKNNVQLSWYNSTSHDVVENVLERKARQEDTFTKIYTCTSDRAIGEFKDVNVVDGVKYEYKCYAIDDAGLRSGISGSMKITAFVDKTLAAPERVMATVSKDEKLVNLNWKHDQANDIRFAIYRSLNESPYQSYKMIQGEAAFKDIGYKTGDIVRYKIKAINTKGWQSSFSSEVVATFDSN